METMQINKKPLAMIDCMLPELTVVWIVLAFSSPLQRTHYVSFDQRTIAAVINHKPNKTRLR